MDKDEFIRCFTSKLYEELDGHLGECSWKDHDGNQMRLDAKWNLAINIVVQDMLGRIFAARVYGGVWVDD